MSILSKLQNRQLGLLELLAMGYSLYFNNFRIFASLLCIVLPFEIIHKILVHYQSIDSNLSNLVVLLSLIYNIFVTITYISAIALTLESIVLNKKLRIKAVLKQILYSALPLINLSIRFYVILYLRTFLLIIPGIIYSVNNFFYYLAFILRGQRGKSAFQYSRSLVKGNWWKVFFFVLLIAFNYIGVLSIFNKIVSIFIPNYPIVVNIISTILTNLVGVGITTSIILLFLNLDFQKR